MFRFDWVLFMQGIDSGAQYMLTKITQEAFSREQKTQSFRPNNVRGSGEQGKGSYLLPSNLKCAPCANMGTPSVPHANFLLERQEELSTSRTCLFRIRLQFAHIWTSLVSPTPTSLYLKEFCQENKVPQHCSSLKVSRVFS